MPTSLTNRSVRSSHLSLDILTIWNTTTSISCLNSSLTKKTMKYFSNNTKFPILNHTIREIEPRVTLMMTLIQMLSPQSYLVKISEDSRQELKNMTISCCLRFRKEEGSLSTVLRDDLRVLLEKEFLGFCTIDYFFIYFWVQFIGRCSGGLPSEGKIRDILGEIT